MQRKTGIVVKISENYVHIKTVKSEFYNVKLKEYTPNIGDIYSGPVIKKNCKLFNRLLSLIILIMCSLFIKNIYAYFSPKASITINIPPTIQLKINKWNTVVDISSTRKSGRALLSNLNLKKLPLETALIKIVETAKEKNIINNDYILNKNNTITIYTSMDINCISLCSFEKYLKDRKLNYKINYDGTDRLD